MQRYYMSVALQAIAAQKMELNIIGTPKINLIISMCN